MSDLLVVLFFSCVLAVALSIAETRPRFERK